MTRTASWRSEQGQLVHRAGLVALCGLLCGGARPAWSAPGDLDASFGTGGTVTLVFSTNSKPDTAAALVVQPDGKVVVGGTKDGSGFALARLNADGTLDGSFGTGGITPDAVGGIVTALVRQADGKLVAVGYSSSAGLVVARYKTDGHLDTTAFGAPFGFITAALPGEAGVATAGALAPDGKIVVAGFMFDRTAAGYDIAVGRVNTDGTLDGSFGVGGMVATDVGGKDDGAFAVAVQPDGKIVVAGHSFASATNGYDIALVRYASNGFLDGSFGTGGKVLTDLGTRDDRAFGLLRQPDGKLVVAGQTFGFDLLDTTLVRYDANGAVDATFGSAGKAVIAVSSGHDAARAVARQGDGKLVVAGYAAAGTSTDLAVARLNANGTADSTFGSGGKVVTTAGPQGDEARAIAIQPDGKLVVAGRTKVPFAGSFGGTGYADQVIVARYLP